MLIVKKDMNFQFGEKNLWFFKLKIMLIWYLNLMHWSDCKRYWKSTIINVQSFNNIFILTEEGKSLIGKTKFELREKTKNTSELKLKKKKTTDFLNQTGGGSYCSSLKYCIRVSYQELGEEHGKTRTTSTNTWTTN